MKKSLSFLLVTALFTLSLQQITLRVVQPSILQKVIPNGLQAKVLMWGKHDTMDDMISFAHRADPVDGCEKYTNVESKTSKRFIYFIKSGAKSCSLGTQIHNAQEAEAIALIIEHSEDNLDDIEIPDHITGRIYLLYRCQHPSINDPKGEGGCFI